MAKFFIDRPVFAWVASILIMLMGILAITKLPVAQYPSIAPPSVSITAIYAGADADTLQNTVTAVIEQQMNGLDGLLYISSTSESAGQSTITPLFPPRHESRHRPGPSPEQSYNSRPPTCRRSSSKRVSSLPRPRLTFLCFSRCPTRTAGWTKSRSALTSHRTSLIPSAAWTAWVKPTCSAPRYASCAHLDRPGQIEQLQHLTTGDLIAAIQAAGRAGPRRPGR